MIFFAPQTSTQIPDNHEPNATIIPKAEKMVAACDTENPRSTR